MYNGYVMEEQNIKKSFFENLFRPVGILASLSVGLAFSALVLFALRKESSADLFECLYTAVSAFTLCGSSIVNLTGFGIPGIFFIALLCEAGAVFALYVSCRLILACGHTAELVIGRKRWLFALASPTCGRDLLVYIISYLAVLQVIGGLALFGVFAPAYPAAKAAGLAAFTSVSAVTGCGMSLLDGRALGIFSVNYSYDIVCSVLVLLSALGPLFAAAAVSARSRGRLSRTMLMQSVCFLILTVVMCAAVCALEWDGTLPAQSAVSTAVLRVLGARSASLMGENTVGSVSFASRVILFIAMFTGGLSGSSTGGLRMGAVMLLCIYLVLAPSCGENIRTKKVRFARSAFIKPIYLALSGIAFILVMSLAMSAACSLDYSDVLFETASAYTLSGIHAADVRELPAVFSALYIVTMLAGRLLPMYFSRALDLSVSKEEPFSEQLVLGRSDMVV